MLLVIFTGCASYQIGQRREPTTIIIRNSSNTYIEEVSIREVKKRNQYVRMGMISPLPVGVSQSVGRPTDAPKMPNEIMICWIRDTNEKKCSNIDVKKVLKAMTDSTHAIVFEILPQSNVDAYLE